MTKGLTTALAMGLIFSVNAQVTPPQAPAAATESAPSPTKALTGFETQGTPVLKPQPANFYAKAINETIIGETVYDLQTNSTIQNRNLVHPDGTISAVYTFGMTQPAFNDRGSAYNYRNGTWLPNPTSRIETVRTGWPSLIYTGGNSEIVISHAGSGSFLMNKRASKGSGAWTETTIPTNSGNWLLWPRAVSGGANGNSLHCIGITAPVFNGGTTYQGIDGALLYWRSTDEGVTWDIVDSILPGLDSLHFNRFRADNYSIIADGDRIAIAVFNQWSDLVLLKSNDNGTTWTTQLVNDFPLDLYVPDQANGSDINGDLIADTIETCDEAGAMLFDDNGMVHLTFGRMRVLDNNLSDGNTSYFPLTEELLYWNESMGTGNFTVIAVPEDVNNDGFLDYAGSFAAYYTSLCGSPSMGKNADGTIFVAYAGYREDLFTVDQNHRHIYVTKTMDGGTSWFPALDVTPDPTLSYYECAFPNMAPDVTNKVRLHYMRDSEPGLSARGDMDAYGLNAIVYLEIDTNLINDASLDELSTRLVQSQLFPNPADGEVHLQLILSQSKTVSLQMTNIKGERMSFGKELNLKAGTHELPIETNHLPAGVYIIRIEMDGKTRTEKLVIEH